MILRMFYSFLIFSFSLNLFGCYGMRQSAGGGVLSEPGERVSNPSDIALPEGYSIEAVATGFTFPTGVTFDEQGIPYVVEAGYSYGEVSDVPRLLRVEKGMSTVVAMGAETGSWTGVVRHGG